MPGDADIASVAALIADPGRARILLALGDGRALPASVLAAEAGVAASTASGHLAKLLQGGLLSVERHGRHRYYRLSGEPVGELIETLARLSPPQPVRSLRQSTAAGRLRSARTCYDHLAGRLGTELMASLLRAGVLSGGDGRFDAQRRVTDRLAAPGTDVDYRLTDAGAERLRDFGIDFAALPRRRPLVRYCVDWTEQRHHLAGALGAALTDRLFALGWIARGRRDRSVEVTAAGATGLRETFNLALIEPQQS